MTWMPNNKKHYESKGYIFTKYKDKFSIKVEDISHGSGICIDVLCDICGDKRTITAQDYYRILNRSGVYACPKCGRIKAKHTCQEKYGCDNPSQNEDVKLKKIKTSLLHYGTNQPSQSQEVKDKIKQSLIEKYGVDCALKNPKVKQKSINTLMKNYGVDHPTKSKIIRDKVKQTNLRLRGVECSLQDPQVRQKSNETLLSHGACHTSTQQFAIYQMLDNVYDYCVLNLPFDYYSLDVCIDHFGIMVDVEYDAPYWHQNKAKDNSRDGYMRHNGFKVLRIQHSHKIPTLQQLQQYINQLAYSQKDVLIVQL